jgi:Holin of 3TMs, for gene-transfer release
MALDPLTAALDIGGKLVDRLFPDPVQRASAQLELLKLGQSGDLAQIAVNQAEAASGSFWTGGWRPSMGWCCVAAYAWNSLGLPMARLAADLMGHPLHLSPADLGEMTPILLGMLGLSGLRTAEKVKGVAR